MRARSDRVLELQGVSFNLIGQPTAKREIGLIAQDVEPIVPEMIQLFQAFDSAGRLAANKLALALSETDGALDRGGEGTGGARLGA